MAARKGVTSSLLLRRVGGAGSRSLVVLTASGTWHPVGAQQVCQQYGRYPGSSVFLEKILDSSFWQIPEGRTSVLSFLLCLHGTSKLAWDGDHVCSVGVLGKSLPYKRRVAIFYLRGVPWRSFLKHKSSQIMILCKTISLRTLRRIQESQRESFLIPH